MDHMPSLSSPISLTIIAASAITAVHLARDDPSAVAFALFSFSLLFSLFACLRAYEELRDDDPQIEVKKKRSKTAVWILATILSFTFSWRLSALMPFAMAVVIWVMTVFVALLGFYALFLY